MSKFYTNVARYGNKLLVRGYKDGIQYKERIEFAPTLYVTDNSANSEPTFRSLDKAPLKPVEFESIKAAKDFIDRYDDVTGFEIFGNSNWQYQYLGSTWSKEVPWSVTDVRTYTIDIETTVQHGLTIQEMMNNPIEEILLITLQNKQTKQFTVFSAKPFKVDFGDRKVDVVLCKDEDELLTRFLEFWNRQQIDIITGWNIKFFDIPYIVGRLNLLYGGSEIINLLSPWKLINSRDVEFQGRSVTVYELVGIATLDYMDLYKKYVKTPRESYKLDQIAYDELGENKTKNPTDSFKAFYTDFWDTFVLYNLRDVEIVDSLEDKLRLIELQMTVAYFAKTNYEDIFGQVKVWETIIYNHLKNSGRIPNVKANKSIKTGEFVGGYVKETMAGKHRYAASFDLDGLYPHIIMQYNMSPETMVQGFSKFRNLASVEGFLNRDIDTSKAKELNYSLTANGVCYDNTSQGFLPELMEHYYATRKKIKRKMLNDQSELEKIGDASPEEIKKLTNEISKGNNTQLGIKVLLNSLYGALGNQGFRYFDLRMAEGITLSGQLSIRWIANALNAFLDKNSDKQTDRVIASDTDSVVGDTLVYVNNKQIKIEDLYSRFSEFEYKDDFNKNYVKPVNEITTLSFNTKTKLIEEKPIKYVMKHRVNKRMFKITLNGKYVIVTEDHSVIVKRNNRYISIKPAELNVEIDKIINIIEPNNQCRLYEQNIKETEKSKSTT